MRFADYLVPLACVFGVNLLPAFGPPTWAVLVFFRIKATSDRRLLRGTVRLVLAVRRWRVVRQLRCEQAVRSYDPCISCATHFLRIDIDRA